MRRKTGQKHFKSLTIGRKGRGWGMRTPRLGAWVANSCMGRGSGYSGGRFGGWYNRGRVDLWFGERREGSGAGGS